MSQAGEVVDKGTNGRGHPAYAETPDLDLNQHDIMRELQSTINEEYRKAPEEAMRLYDGKTIEEAFPHVLKSQLESRLHKLEAGRQAMLP